MAQSNNEFYYGSSKLFGPDTEPGQQQEVVEEAFGDSNTFVLLVPNGDLAKEREVNVQLLQQPQIIDVISYANTVGTEIPMEYLDENILSKLISQHYSCMVMTANVPSEGEDAFALVQRLRQLAASYYGEQYYWQEIQSAPSI